MSAAVAPFPSRFVRRTVLGENEYRVNFKQIDNDVIKALVSAEARKVTPQMSTIYLSLLASPPDCWERDGVVRFAGEDREERHLTAWEQMREIAGVANSTLSKALDWMHQTGLIGYDARANGAGIRIFFNRASSSIRPTPEQKNLRILPTPTLKPPTPTDGVGFKEVKHEKVRDNKFRAFAREENPAGHDLSVAPSADAARTISDPVLRIVPNANAEPDPAFIAALTRQIANELRPEIAETVKRETVNTREWFLNHGLPKATRVAQRETYDLLRAYGVIAKKTPNGGEVGRSSGSAEQGREGKREGNPLAAFLEETGNVLRQATDPGNTILHAACGNADRGLRELHDRVAAGEWVEMQEIENRLAKIEADLTEALWQATDRADIETMLRSANTELQSYAGRMEREVFEETLRRQVTTRLRERHGIPRISLFYL